MEKKKISWYEYNEQAGILAYADNEKFKNVKPLEEGDDGLNFYTLASLEGIEIEPSDVCLCLSDSYNGEQTEKGGRINIHYVRNPENEQKLMYAWEYDDVAEDDEAVRELNILTDRYYDWKSELRKFVEIAEDNEETKEELQKEWEEISKNYTFRLSNPLEFDKIWDEIEYRRNK